MDTVPVRLPGDAQPGAVVELYRTTDGRHGRPGAHPRTSAGGAVNCCATARYEHYDPR
jgi:hypothetical protein